MIENEVFSNVKNIWNIHIGYFVGDDEGRGRMFTETGLTYDRRAFFKY